MLSFEGYLFHAKAAKFNLGTIDKTDCGLLDFACFAVSYFALRAIQTFCNGLLDGISQIEDADFCRFGYT